MYIYIHTHTLHSEILRNSVVCHVVYLYLSYNRVKKNQLDAQLILSIFRQPLFRAYLDPSSGGTTLCIQQLVCYDWKA
jgi:hypothetical protein